MTNICVVGDSFSTCDPNFPGKHWSEILQCKLEGVASVVNFAIPGSPHLGIYLQIKKVLETVNDIGFVIVNGTACGRFFCRKPGRDEKVTSILDSCGLTDNKPYYTIQPIRTPMAFEDEERCKAIKSYYMHIADDLVAATIDNSLMELGLLTLLSANIPFVFNEGGFLRVNGKENTLPNAWYFSDQRFVDYRLDLNVWHFPVSTNIGVPRFHTKEDSDLQYIAEVYYNEIKQRLPLLNL